MKSRLRSNAAKVFSSARQQWAQSPARWTPLQPHSCSNAGRIVARPRSSMTNSDRIARKQGKTNRNKPKQTDFSLQSSCFVTELSWKLRLPRAWSTRGPEGLSGPEFQRSSEAGSGAIKPNQTKRAFPRVQEIAKQGNPTESNQMRF